MKLAQRIHYHSWLTEKAFNRTVAFCEKYRGCMDELALFTEYQHHGYRDMSLQREDYAVLGKRIADLKARGFGSVGVNVLTTIGHIDEAYTCFDQPFQPIVGFDGRASKSCICPSDKKVLEYVAEKYRLVAQLHPDFIWVDDDVKLFYNGVKFGCFCDGCMKRFNEKTGASYTRETLVAAMNEPDAVSLRASWVQDISGRITKMFTLIKNAVRAEDEKLELGFMSTHQTWSTYNGMSFATWYPALDACKGRPGEGTYDDVVPENVCVKALSAARQAMEYPPSVTDVQYEVENFPYHRFQKSNRFVLDECTLAAAQGLGGVLLNTTKCEPHSTFDDFFTLYDAITVRRRMWNRMTEFSRELKTRGFYPAISSSYDAHRSLHDGESFFVTYDEAPKHNVIKTYAFCHIGIPLTTDRSAANGVILTGNIPDGYTDEELIAFLSGAVIMDADALHTLERRGLGNLAGVRWDGEAGDAVLEHYNLEDPVAQSLTDEYRDIRIGFFGHTGAILEPLDDSVRAVSYLENYCGKRLGITSSLYHNEYGGRVCVLGYGAFTRVESPSRKLLMMRICDELTQDKMPVKVLDDCKAAVFVRSDESGEKTMVTFLNMSLDDTGSIRVAIRGARRIRLLAADGAETEMAVMGQGRYGVVAVPNTPAYETCVLLAEK